MKNRWNAHLSKRAGQVPNGPPRGGMTLEELEREFGIIENMLELIKANAAQYKVGSPQETVSSYMQQPFSLLLGGLLIA